MTMPTGSTVARAIQCAASMVLPRVERTSDAAERGTAIHAFLAAASTRGRDEALADVPDEHRPYCEALDLSTLPVDSIAYAAEVALRYDVATGKAEEIGRNVGRQYGALRPYEIAMSLDVLGLTEDAAFYLDFKAGRARVRARDSWQLRVGALAACRAYRRDRAIVALVYLSEDGDVYYDCAELDELDLSETAAELVRLAARVDASEQLVRLGKVPNVTTGPECRYCGCYEACPANVALLRRLVTEPDKVESEAIAGLSSDKRFPAYVLTRRIEELAERLKEARRAVATANPIALPDGRIYGPKLEVHQVINANVARNVLAGAYGPDVADRACTFETSKSAIEKAVGERAKALNAKMAPAQREALAQIRAAGGVKDVQKVRIVEHFPEKKDDEVAA